MPKYDIASIPTTPDEQSRLTNCSLSLLTATGAFFPSDGTSRPTYLSIEALTSSALMLLIGLTKNPEHYKANIAALAANLTRWGEQHMAHFDEARSYAAAARMIATLTANSGGITEAATEITNRNAL